MTFDEWWTDIGHMMPSIVKIDAREAWNAAIEHAAMMVGKRGAEPEEMQPESIAREIRMMRSKF